ncbi:sulfite exporter TauE/SafE family protein [Spiroplasma endosymbiont of Labia minor]|uniref:sulfite exporter TauE/SafE family protein n=1 Tax=Spiroplasma endosymbiont of Labia minor TaxID=3066305 RepID=UPI0030CFD812
MGLAAIIPILIFASILISFFGSIAGVGGGVLFIPLLLMIFPEKSFEELKFVSTLLVFISAFINVLIEIIKKRINWWLMLVILIFSVPSILFGNWLATLFDQNIAKLIIAVLLFLVTVLLIIAEYVIKPLQLKKSENIDQTQTDNVNASNLIEQKKNSWFMLKINADTKVNLFWIILITIVGGIVTSVTGMGGGPILMPMLLLICLLSMKEAAPISHIIIGITSAVSLIFQYNMFDNKELNLHLSLPMIMGVIAGTIACMYAKKYITKEIYIKWILIVLIWVSIGKIIFDLASNW